MLRLRRRTDAPFSLHLRWNQKNFLRVIFLLFFLGMIYGAVMVNGISSETLDKLSFLTQGFIDTRAEQSVVLTFVHSFFSSGMLLLCLFLLGFSAIGQPFALFIPIFRGLGLGLSMGYLYVHNGWKGAMFCLLLILPQAFFSTFALLLGTKESIRFSNLFFSVLLPKKETETDKKDILRFYLIKFLVLTAIVALSALVDGICTFLFAGFFAG